MIWQSSPPVPLCERPPCEERALTLYTPDFERARSALFAVPWKDFDYDGWFRLACSFNYATGGSDDGLAALNEWGSEHPRHDDDFVAERVWKHLRSERSGALITERTLFATAKKYGWADPLEGDVADDFEVVEVDNSVPRGTGDPLRFAFIDEEEFIAGPPLLWFIRGVMPRAELGEIYGASSSGKSFLAYDMAAAIEMGIEWRGHKVTKARTGYVVAEGARGFRNRVLAYRIHKEVKRVGVKLFGGVPSLMQKKDVDDLIAGIKASQLEIVFFDTLARMTSGADENSAQDIGRILHNCSLIHHATGAMIVVVHHAGKDATKGARGSSKIKDFLDVEIEVSRCEHDRVATITKMKDGEGEGDEFGFKLITVPVSMDDDGDVMSSCVVEHSDVLPRDKRKSLPKGDVEKAVWQIVLDLQGIDGGSPPTDDVLTEYAARTPHDPEKRDRRREHALRALNTLRDRGAVLFEGGKVKLSTDELA